MTRRLTADFSQVLSSRAVDRVARRVKQQQLPEVELPPPPPPKLFARDPVPAPCDMPKEQFVTVTRSFNPDDERALTRRYFRLRRDLEKAKKQGMTKKQRREITMCMHDCEEKLRRLHQQYGPRQYAGGYLRTS